MSILFKKKILAGLVTACLAGCGGGSDSASNSAEGPSTQDPVDPASTGAEPIAATGEIDGFGSVIVNGTHYETDNAVFVIDGEIGTEEQLEVGQVVEVFGELEASGQAVASKVFMRSSLSGQVEMVDIDARTIEVLGHEVRISEDTQLDEAVSEVTLAELEGAHVRISGHALATGSMTATHVDLVEDGLEDSTMFGEIESVDAGAAMLVIDGNVVDYSGAELRGDSDGLAIGNRVIARGAVQDGAFVSDRLYVISASMTEDSEAVVHADSDVQVAVSGVLEIDGSGLTLNGMDLKDIESADILQGTLEDLVADAKVMVEGAQIDGDLIADQITIERASRISVVGSVESVDVDASLIVVAGNTFSVAADTDFKDDSDNDIRMFSLADIVEGDSLKVRGHIDDEGGYVASQIQRLDPNSDAQYLGRLMVTVASVGAGTLLTTDGLEVVIGEDTFIASQVDLDNLVLGEEGTELFIAGIYSTETTLEAKTIILADSLEDGGFAEGQTTVNENGEVTETVVEGTVTRTDEPEVTEPEVAEPEVTEPEVTETVVTETVVTETVVTETEITETEITETEITETEITETEITETDGDGNTLRFGIGASAGANGVEVATEI